jgi:hypothetical protein
MPRESFLDSSDFVRPTIRGSRRLAALRSFVDLFRWGQRSRDLEDAQRASERALELDLNSADAHVAAGQAVAMQRCFPETATLFDRAIKEEPTTFDRFLKVAHLPKTK